MKLSGSAEGFKRLAEADISMSSQLSKQSSLSKLEEQHKKMLEIPQRMRDAEWSIKQLGIERELKKLRNQKSND